ncbi:hypothetical protein VPH35_025688 [Triticum aestivum]
MIQIPKATTHYLRLEIRGMILVEIGTKTTTIISERTEYLFSTQQLCIQRSDLYYIHVEVEKWVYILASILLWATKLTGEHERHTSTDDTRIIDWLLHRPDSCSAAS